MTMTCSIENGDVLKIFGYVIFVEVLPAGLSVVEISVV